RRCATRGQLSSRHQPTNARFFLIPLESFLHEREHIAPSVLDGRIGRGVDVSDHGHVSYRIGRLQKVSVPRRFAGPVGLLGAKEKSNFGPLLAMGGDVGQLLAPTDGAPTVAG